MKNCLDEHRSSWCRGLNMLNWNRERETPLRHVSCSAPEDKLLEKFYNIILNSEAEKFASSRKTFWHFNFLSVCLVREQLDANLNVTCISLTLVSQYHVIITYFRTEFSWGDLGDLCQNTGEIIFVNISILRCICPRLSVCQSDVPWELYPESCHFAYPLVLTSHNQFHTVDSQGHKNQGGWVREGKKQASAKWEMLTF
jgi:hypothetical protein